MSTSMRTSSGQTLWTSDGEYYTVFYKEKKVASHLKTMDDVHDFVSAKIEAGLDDMSEWSVTGIRFYNLAQYIKHPGILEDENVPLQTLDNEGVKQ